MLRAMWIVRAQIQRFQRGWIWSADLETILVLFWWRMWLHFALALKYLPDVKLKSFGLMPLAEAISGWPRIDGGMWWPGITVRQIYSVWWLRKQSSVPGTLFRSCWPPAPSPEWCGYCVVATCPGFCKPAYLCVSEGETAQLLYHCVAVSKSDNSSQLRGVTPFLKHLQIPPLKSHV